MLALLVALAVTGCSQYQELKAPCTVDESDSAAAKMVGLINEPAPASPGVSLSPSLRAWVAQEPPVQPSIVAPPQHACGPMRPAND